MHYLDKDTAFAMREYMMFLDIASVHATVDVITLAITAITWPVEPVQPDQLFARITCLFGSLVKCVSVEWWFSLYGYAGCMRDAQYTLTRH